MGDIEESLLSDRDEHGVAPGTNYVWWIKMVGYSILVLACQSAQTLLLRLYYNNGGSSKWMETLLQAIGFPILIPLYFLSSLKTKASSSTDAEVHEDSPSIIARASIYLLLGIMVALTSTSISVSLEYISASTYALISATQLAFTAFLAFFMNSQKFTPLIINSLVLLTISSVLLVPESDSAESSSSGEVSTGKFILGFVCAVVAAALTGLLNNVIQLSFRKVLKGRPLKVIFELMVYYQLVASCIVLVCFLASGEWKNIKGEMDGFALGKASYVMTLFWTAVTCQVSSFGIVGLIFEVSSLFANVVTVLNVPIVPTAAIFLFHEKMDVDEAISMTLAIWGCISYVYQHYLDDKESARIDNDGSTAS